MIGIRKLEPKWWPCIALSPQSYISFQSYDKQYSRKEVANMEYTIDQNVSNLIGLIDE
jgi:hypothetical protein